MIKIRQLLKESSLVNKAREFATAEHAGVKRFRSNKDYISHPSLVYRMAKKLGLSEEEQIVAYLHDTYEDSNHKEETLKNIREIFGSKITEMVLLITHEKSQDYPSYVLGIAKKNKAVLRVKILDMYSNLIDNPTPMQKEKYIGTMKHLIQQGVNEPLIGKILNRLK